MNETSTARTDTAVTECSLCHRSVLVGEPLTPYHDHRGERQHFVCELCRDRARTRGWEPAGAPQRRAGGTRLRVETRSVVTASTAGDEHDGDELRDSADDRHHAVPKLTAPQAAVLERMVGLDCEPDGEQATERHRERFARQQLELERLRFELNPARRAEEQRIAQQRLAEIRDLRAQLVERDARIARLEQARLAETSPMRMSGYALQAFNQSAELERMARIARTLDAPTVNVHDEGPGIPRRVRITLTWDIAWYEFVAKLDLGAGRASVHETGSGGEPSVVPLERRRANAAWSTSGLKLN